MCINPNHLVVLPKPEKRPRGRPRKEKPEQLEQPLDGNLTGMNNIEDLKDEDLLIPQQAPTNVRSLPHTPITLVNVSTQTSLQDLPHDSPVQFSTTIIPQTTTIQNILQASPDQPALSNHEIQELQPTSPVLKESDSSQMILSLQSQPAQTLFGQQFPIESPATSPKPHENNSFQDLKQNLSDQFTFQTTTHPQQPPTVQQLLQQSPEDQFPILGQQMDSPISSQNLQQQSSSSPTTIQEQTMLVPMPDMNLIQIYGMENIIDNETKIFDLENTDKNEIDGGDRGNELSKQEDYEIINAIEIKKKDSDFEKVQKDDFPENIKLTKISTDYDMEQLKDSDDLTKETDEENYENRKRSLEKQNIREHEKNLGARKKLGTCKNNFIHFRTW